MNLSQLEYVVTAVDTGSFADAARQSYVCPQTVSKAIRQLEQEIGCTLFLRNGKEATPTNAGIAFSEKARVIISLFNDLSDFNPVARKEEI